MRFDFASAGRIVFGCGSVQEIEPAARQFGSRVFLVTGRAPRVESDAAAALSVNAEPDVALVREGGERARQAGCDVVVAVGGGSVIDAGKAIAALLTNPGDPLDYLEVVGRGRPLVNPSAPLIAVPTTSGTGSEVTRNAVLASAEHRVKASMRSPYMLPRVAIVDPELAAGMPPEVTAATGLDALTQCLEPFVSVRANAMTDMFCLDGLRRGAGALRRAFHDGQDLAARTDMAFVSLMGGLALANAGLGAVHGFAAPIGGAFEAPHGAICAALLAPVMDANIRALRSRAPESDALGRYEAAARILTGRAAAAAEDGAEWAASLTAELRIPGLSSYGVTTADVPGLVANAARASSMKANPIVLTPEELTAILISAL